MLADHTYPTASLKRKYSHLADLPLEPFEHVKPLVLIGADYPHLLTPIELVRLGPPGGPAAIHTRLGWILQGPAHITQWASSAQQCLFTSISDAERWEALEDATMEFYCASGNMQWQSVVTSEECSTKSSSYLKTGLFLGSSGETWNVRTPLKYLSGRSCHLAQRVHHVVPHSLSKCMQEIMEVLKRESGIQWSTVFTWIIVYRVCLPQMKPRNWWTGWEKCWHLEGSRFASGLATCLTYSGTYLQKQDLIAWNDGFHRTNQAC